MFNEYSDKIKKMLSEMNKELPKYVPAPEGSQFIRLAREGMPHTTQVLAPGMKVIEVLLWDDGIPVVWRNEIDHNTGTVLAKAVVLQEGYQSQTAQAEKHTGNKDWEDFVRPKVIGTLGEKVIPFFPESILNYVSIDRESCTLSVVYGLESEVRETREQFVKSLK